MKNEVEENFDCEKFKEECLNLFDERKLAIAQKNKQKMKKQLEYFKKEFPSIINVNKEQDFYEDKTENQYEICGHKFFPTSLYSNLEQGDIYLKSCLRCWSNFDSVSDPYIIYDQATFGRYLKWHEELQKDEKQIQKIK